MRVLIYLFVLDMGVCSMFIQNAGQLLDLVRRISSKECRCVKGDVQCKTSFCIPIIIKVLFAKSNVLYSASHSIHMYKALYKINK